MLGQPAWSAKGLVSIVVCTRLTLILATLPSVLSFIVILYNRVFLCLVMIPYINIDSRAVMYNGSLTILVKCGNDKKGVYWTAPTVEFSKTYFSFLYIHWGRLWDKPESRAFVWQRLTVMRVYEIFVYSIFVNSCSGLACYGDTLLAPVVRGGCLMVRMMRYCYHNQGFILLMNNP